METTAKVIEIHKNVVFVKSQNKNFMCRLGQSLFREKTQEVFPCSVGDMVSIKDEIIQKVLPRDNRIYTRLSPYSSSNQKYSQDNVKFQTLCSNVDRLFLLESYALIPKNYRFVEALLILCQQENIPCTLILNKYDLRDKASEALQKRQDYFKEMYESVGVSVCVFSSKYPKKYKETFVMLKELLKDKITAIFGRSGVGKSSFVNLLGPEILQTVDENPKESSQGRHVTSFATFLNIKKGGSIIDIPGKNQFFLEKLQAFELASCFPDFQGYSCHFKGNCTHILEPQCGIKEAVAAGKIHQERYESYSYFLKGS